MASQTSASASAHGFAASRTSSAATSSRRSRSHCAAAQRGGEAWRAVPALERAAVLRRAAQWLRERRDLEPALAQPLRRAQQHRGALERGDRAPGLAAALRGGQGGVDLGLGRRGGHGDHAVGPAGVRGDERVALPPVLADPDGHPQRRARVLGGHGVRELGADGGAAQLEDGLVAERRKAWGERRRESGLSPSRRRERRRPCDVTAHGAASSSSSGTPRDCSCRNDSFEVFSSSRRTR